MLTNPEKDVTVESVEKELADLEVFFKDEIRLRTVDYRARRKKLRALLAVLKAEAE